MTFVYWYLSGMLLPFVWALIYLRGMNAYVGATMRDPVYTWKWVPLDKERQKRHWFWNSSWPGFLAMLPIFGFLGPLSLIFSFPI